MPRNSAGRVAVRKVEAACHWKDSCVNDFSSPKTPWNEAAKGVDDDSGEARVPLVRT